MYFAQNYGVGSSRLGLTGFGEGGGGYGIGLGSIDTIGHGSGPGSAGPRAASFSRTNNQVAAVDESDIVKTDRRYMYIITNCALRIAEALRPRVASVTNFLGDAREMLVDGDRAVVFMASGAGTERCTYGYDCTVAGDGTSTRVHVLDIRDRTAPKQVREIDLSGSLIASRRIGTTVHTVVTDDDGAPPDDPGNPTVDFHGEKRSNATHESTTDRDAKLARKGRGKEAKLSYSGHALMENRNGLIVDVQIDVADGFAEQRNALSMLEENLPGVRRITLAADKGYDTRDFVEDCRSRCVTPHVSQNITSRRDSQLDGRTTSAPGYAISQRVRKRVEEIFGWKKTVGGFRKTRYAGLGANQLAGHMIAAAYDLLRIAKLTEAA